MEEKLVIYKDCFGFKVTPESNYGIRIQNARKIKDLSAFSSAEEIIEYYCKWFNSKPEDFIDKTKE